MEYLASELQKYYRKVHNKLIFTNGMDLNQLALEMWTELGFRGADASLLSRVLHGERLFTKEQLYVFYTILELNDSEKYSLTNALGKDLLYKHIGTVVPISDFDELLADQRTGMMILEQIRKLKDTGDMQEAMHIASFFEHVFTFTPKIQQANKSLYAKILEEKVRCLIYTEKPNTILPKVKELNNTSLRLGYELKDPDIISLAHAHIGGCLYVAKRHKESAIYLEKTYGMVNPHEKVEYVRTLLNNYAFLGDGPLHRTAYTRAEKILSEKEKYNKSNIASTHEAISRSFALMGDVKRAKKFLETIDTRNLETFFQSEMVRGKMFVCYQDYLKHGKVDRDEIKQLFFESKQREFHFFQRHRGQIAKMYQEMCYG